MNEWGWMQSIDPCELLTDRPVLGCDDRLPSFSKWYLYVCVFKKLVLYVYVSLFVCFLLDLEKIEKVYYTIINIAQEIYYFRWTRLQPITCTVRHSSKRLIAPVETISRARVARKKIWLTQSQQVTQYRAHHTIIRIPPDHYYFSFFLSPFFVNLLILLHDHWIVCSANVVLFYS